MNNRETNLNDGYNKIDITNDQSGTFYAFNDTTISSADFAKFEEKKNEVRNRISNMLELYYSYYPKKKN